MSTPMAMVTWAKEGLVEDIDYLLKLTPPRIGNGVPSSSLTRRAKARARRHKRTPPCSRASSRASTWGPHTLINTRRQPFRRLSRVHPQCQRHAYSTDSWHAQNLPTATFNTAPPQPTPTTTSQPPRRRRPRRCHQPAYTPKTYNPTTNARCFSRWVFDLAGSIQRPRSRNAGRDPRMDE